MTIARRLYPLILMPAFFMLLTLFLFIPYITKGLSFITFSSLSGLSAFKYQMGRAFLAGEYPLWNPYTICGSPFHTGIGILDPFLMPQLFLKGSLAVISSSYFALVCAGPFMFIYLKKSWGMSILASLLGGALYLTNPFFAAASYEPPFMNSPVYLPLILLFSDLGIRKKSYFYSCLAGIALAMSFLSGNIESYCYIAVVFLALQAARIDTLSFDRLRITPGKQSASRGLSVVKFLLISLFVSIVFMAIDLLPTIEACLASSRRDSYILSQSALFIALSAILAFLAAKIYRGVILANKKTANIAKAALTALLFVLFTVNFNKERSTWFITGIFRQESMHSFHDPAYLFTILSLAAFLSLLWLNRKAIIDFYIFFAIFLALPSYTLFPDLFKYLLHMNTVQFPRVMFAFFFITSLSIAYYVDILNNGNPGRRVMRLMLTILLISEAVAGWNIYTYQKNDIKILDGSGPEINFLLKRMNRDYRIGIWRGDSGYETGDNRPIEFDLSWNTSLFWGAGNIEKSAMNFTKPRFDRLWQVEERNTGVTPTILAGITTPIYNLMGMRYLFSKERLEKPGYSLLLKGDAYYIYENRNAFGRLYSVSSLTSESAPNILSHIKNSDFDPKNTVYVEADNKIGEGDIAADTAQERRIRYKTIKDSYNIKRFEVDASQKTFIVSTDAFDKNWNAYIDGVKTRLYLCNYYFMGFLLDKGVHTIEFRYEPVSFFIGLMLTLTVLIITTLLYFHEKYKKGNTSEVSHCH